MAKKITKEELQNIIKEGVQNTHKRTLLENERKELNKELFGILIESEVATSNTMEIMDGYLEAALWTEEDEVGPASIHIDISDDAKIDAYQDVKKFMSQAGDLIDTLEPSQVGHDLWLTRNGHGAGFWDRGLGEVGDKLSDIARSMGSKHLYRGDDGQIHID